MKVLIAGNLANMGFEIAKAMRKKNIDVKLLMQKYPKGHDDPKLMYAELNEKGYPKWIITYDNKNRSLGLSNWKIQVIKEMRKNYDAIIALTEFAIFAMLSGKSYAVHSTGSDMRELAFENSLKGFLYRLSYKFARVIIWGEPDKLPIIKKLKISKKAIFCPSPRNIKFEVQNIERGNLENKFVIFHPVSQCWKTKQNDKFLKAFEKLCLENDNVYLIISERGPDLNKAKKILDGKKTKDKHKFVPDLNASQMQYFYNLCDVVVDQFGVGSIGMITVEAMKYGKAVIVHLDEQSFKACYKTPPESLINVNSSEKILEELRKMISNPKICKEIGEKNKNWVKENWNTDKLTDRYIKICNAIIENNISIVGNPHKLE